MSEITAMTSFCGCGPLPVVSTYAYLRLFRNVIFSRLCATNLMFFKLCVTFCLPSIVSAQFSVLMHVFGLLWVGHVSA